MTSSLVRKLSAMAFVLAACTTATSAKGTDPAIPAAPGSPELPALLRDVHLVEKVSGAYAFTRPMVPAVRTTADGRVGIDVRMIDGKATLYLLGPEALAVPFLQSSAGAQEIVLESRRLPSTMFSQNTGNTKHHAICDADPSPQDCGGNDCYDFTIVASVVHMDRVMLVGTEVTVEVDEPKTVNATIVDVRLGASVNSGYLLDDAGTEIETVLEPTITSDGRLLVFRIGRMTADLDGFVETTDLVYATYPEANGDPCDVTLWTELHRISHAPFDANMIGRYGIADVQFTDATGVPIPDGRDLLVTYPWIDRAGSNLFFEAVGATLTYTDSAGIVRERYPATCVPTVGCPITPAPENTTIPTRGISFVGRWSQGRMVLLDGVFNNIDYGLLRAEEAQRMIALYTDPLGIHDGTIRIGTGRDNGNGAAPPLSTTNTAVIDSLENIFAYRPTMQPLTTRDVVWLLNTGKASDEVVFDDFLDPDAVIVSDMVAALEWRSGERRLVYHDGFQQTGPTHGEGFTETVLVQNAAGSTLGGMSVPPWGLPHGSVRMEPVALGGVSGKGMWLDGNAGITYTIPMNTSRDTLYTGVFIDNRAVNWNGPRRLFTFPDGSHLSFASQQTLEYTTAGSTVVASIALPAPLPVAQWSHIGVMSRNFGHEVELYLNGFLYDLWSDANESLFGFGTGDFTLGASGLDEGAHGWVDELRMIARDPGPEVICNHARGTLIGLDAASDQDWIDWASDFPIAAHQQLDSWLPAASIMPAYACFHNYGDPPAANLQALPAGTVSLREALLFPEGPLTFGDPRPDSTTNPFCISCHHANADSPSLDVIALVEDATTPMELDPRRQPLQPPPLLFGNVPAGFFASMLPPAALVAPATGLMVDEYIYP